MLRALEAGACGIVAPMIRDRADVDLLCNLSKYPPAGERGTCLGNAHTEYTIPDARAYMDEQNEETLLIGQIETTESLHNLDAILNSGKIDVAFIGPLDLSVSLGNPGDLGSDEQQNAIERVLKSCQEHGVLPGSFAPDAESGRALMKQGFRMISCSTELSIFASKSKEIAERLRG